MSDLFWEFQQQRRIRDAQVDASSAKRRADRAGSDLSRLEARVERLSLLCQAMWELIREQTGLTDEHVVARMTEIDARDGGADGKAAVERLDCPSCGRKGNSSQAKCIYCGQDFTAVRKHLFH